jgi:DNA (cytosine-5)-methyltransferase 1
VRRLTPRECERLQGLPDNYTLIPYGRQSRRGKDDAAWMRYLMQGGALIPESQACLAADGPRYKAIGNSIAVPCLAWLGQRLLRAMS